MGRPGLTRRLIAVDWGTTSLRGALLDDTGCVLDEKSAPLGILNVTGNDFAGTFAAQFAGWMREPDSLCLISGMAGSRQGWREAPYAPCPAGLRELARRLLWIEPAAPPSCPASASNEAACPT